MSALVLVSLEAWDDVWRRNQHLATGLLGSEPDMQMLFVEPAVDPLHARRAGQPTPRGRGLRTGPLASGVRAGQLWLYEPTKWLPRRADPWFERRWAASVVRAASRAGLRQPLLWVNSPSGAHVLAHTGWPALYDITDDWLAADRTSRELQRTAREEAYLLEHCAEVVVCSSQLRHSKRAARVTLIPNAVDADAYRLHNPRPSDLPHGPVALYAGTLHEDRLDVDLCVSTARALGTRGQLVLVGPDLLASRHRSRLKEAGAVILGPRAHEDIPAYLQNAEALVVPHLVTAFTESLDPIKVYEYRASGRPVISTPVAGFRDCADPVVTVTDALSFPEATRRLVLESPSTTTPIQALSVPSWDDRVQQFQEVLRRLNRRRPPA